MQALIERGEGTRTLIAVEGDALANQWAEVLATWLPEATVFRANRGAKAYRDFQTTEGPVVMIATYALIHGKGRRAWMGQIDWSLIVLDEVSVLKGAKARQATIREISRVAARCLGLTATELENDGRDVWAILDAVGTPNLWHRGEFDETFIEWQPGYTMPNGQEVEPKAIGLKAEALAEFRAYLAEVAIRRREDESGQHFPVRVGPDVVWVQPTAAQQRRLLWTNGLTAGRFRHIQREIACNYAYGTSAKALAAAEWLDRNPPHQKVLVYAHNLEHLDIMGDLLKARGIGFVRIEGRTEGSERLDAVDEFNDDPSVRVMLGSRVLERGLDALKIASSLVTLGCSDNPAREAQREGRVRRIGSPHATYEHITFMLDHPHDRKKWADLGGKRSQAQSLRHIA
jgi:SNF2 family DNA or RNA helicase